MDSIIGKIASTIVEHSDKDKDCIDESVKKGLPISEECSDKNFLKTWGVSKNEYRANVLNELEEENRQRLIRSREIERQSDENFLKTWGISKDDFYKKTLKEAAVVRKDFEKYEDIRESMRDYEKYEQAKESDQHFQERWGMTKDEFYDKTLKEVRTERMKDDKVYQAMNKMAEIINHTGIDDDEIGSVFEKPQYPDLKEGLTKVKGIDQNVLDNLKNQVDMLDSSKKEAELKSRDEATMSGPSTHSSFGDLK